MPLFQITNTSLTAVEQQNFDSEKRLQHLIEANLRTVFSCRLVASEFSTGALHAGRIDTLALSEDDNPVIIEYKKAESSELINQGLFYLHWLQDHRGDFEVAARKALRGSFQVDWSDVRVICIAPNYKKFDLHAVQVMGANIELWRYRYFKNSCLYLEEVYRRNLRVAHEPPEHEKDPVMVAAGKKAAQTRATGIYTVEQQLAGKPQPIVDLAMAIRDFISGLDTAIEETPKKLYIAYKITQNIACMELRKQTITLYLKLNPSELPNLPPIARDVTAIGHYGTGDLEVTIQSDEDLETAKPLIEAAYRHVGG